MASTASSPQRTPGPGRGGTRAWRTGAGIALLFAIGALGACADGFGGYGAGPGARAGMGSGMGSGMGGMGGMGMGGMGMGSMGAGMARGGADVTPGWSMMSEEERQAHMAQMQGARTRGECLQIMEQHHAQMQQRALERGMSPPSGPPMRACQSLPE